ncbi:hypothetical protein ACC691_39810, partial [Rhizobium johnstonii]|uniref:hypothetical protein n=1 Tax=Rhizobium johnstonii TaxID=3019933 RepID=UPI003F98EAE9
GSIQGTPTTAGQFTFTVIATNTDYPLSLTSPSRQFTINVAAAAPTVDDYDLGDLTVGQHVNHTFTGSNVEYWYSNVRPAGRVPSE